MALATHTQSTGGKCCMEGQRPNVEYFFIRALGVVIFEMTAGHLPFLAPSQSELYEKISNNEIVFPQ